MVANVAQDYLQDSARTTPQMKAAMEQLLDKTNEMLGGQGWYSSNIEISSGVLTVVDSFHMFVADVENHLVATSDDLDRIATAGAFHDGQLLGLKIASTARLITYKHNAGGAGQIYLRGGADYTPRDASEILWLQYDETTTSFKQVLVDYLQLLNLILGVQAPATYTVTSKVVTPIVPVIKLDAGAATDVERIAQDNFNYGCPFILVTAANATFAKTMKHNTGTGSGKMTLKGSVDFVIVPNMWVLFIQSGTTWVEIGRWVAYNLPSTLGTALQKLRVNAGATALEFADDTTGGWTISTQSSSFVLGAAKTRYVVTGNSADITVSNSTATSGNRSDEWEIVNESAYDVIITPYSGEFVRDNAIKDTVSLRIPALTSRRIRLLAIQESSVKGLLVA